MHLISFRFHSQLNCARTHTHVHSSTLTHSHTYKYDIVAAARDRASSKAEYTQVYMQNVLVCSFVSVWCLIRSRSIALFLSVSVSPSACV